MPDRILTDTSTTQPLHAPIERVDLTGWLLALHSDEYRRCAPGEHIAGGATTTEDGRLMSINVELIADALMVQQFTGDVAERHLVRMVSPATDLFTPVGRTTTRAIWTLEAARLDTRRSTLTNRLRVVATDALLDYCDDHGMRFDELRAALDTALCEHVRTETPLFASSIEQHSLGDDVARAGDEHDTLGPDRSPRSRFHASVSS